MLFIGLAVGGVITYSFLATGEPGQAEASGTLPRQQAAAAITATPAETAPAMTPRLASAAAEGRVIQVGIFGDSFGDGIHAALYR
ncbi:MAG TPA: hypothetical protein VGB54_10485, partial [Allosphingosinicella sp.]